MTRLPRFALLLLVLLVSGCALNVTPAQPKACLDNLPPKLILGDSCKDGVCGFTCEAGRWAPVHLIIDDRGRKVAEGILTRPIAHPTLDLGPR